MTPRAWSYGLLFAGILWAALIVAWWLIVAAQTVGVEAWHDSALPQGAFVAIRSAGVSTPAPTLHQPRTSAGGRRSPVQEKPASSPSPRAVSRLAASSGTQRHIALAPAPSMTGTASTYGPGYDGYLALPAGRGIHVRICGAGGCIDRVSNDTGPVPSLHRVADLDVATFERVCGVPWTRGLCRVSVEEVLGG